MVMNWYVVYWVGKVGRLVNEYLRGFKKFFFGEEGREKSEKVIRKKGLFEI